MLLLKKRNAWPENRDIQFSAHKERAASFKAARSLQEPGCFLMPGRHFFEWPRFLFFPPEKDEGQGDHEPCRTRRGRRLATAASADSPGSTKPATRLYMPGGKFGDLASKISCPFFISTMTAGEILG